MKNRRLKGYIDQFKIILIQKIIAMPVLWAHKYKGTLRKQDRSIIDPVDSLSLADEKEFIKGMGMKGISFPHTELMLKAAVLILEGENGNLLQGIHVRKGLVKVLQSRSPFWKGRSSPPYPKARPQSCQEGRW